MQRVRAGMVLPRDGASSGAPPGFPNCPQSLKQWDRPRSSSEHALRLVRKMLLKGRSLLETVQFPLHGASQLLLGRVRESPTRFEPGRAASRTCRPKGLDHRHSN
jgi:hypothetical protein